VRNLGCAFVFFWGGKSWAGKKGREGGKNTPQGWKKGRGETYKEEHHTKKIKKSGAWGGKKRDDGATDKRTKEAEGKGNKGFKKREET